MEFREKDNRNSRKTESLKIRSSFYFLSSFYWINNLLINWDYFN